MREKVNSAIGHIPQVKQAAMQVAKALLQKGLTHEEVHVLLQIAERALQHPEEYQAIRKKVLQTGLFSPQLIPEQFDPSYISVLINALNIAHKQLQSEGPLSGVEER